MATLSALSLDWSTSSIHSNALRSFPSQAPGDDSFSAGLLYRYEYVVILVLLHEGVRKEVILGQVLYVPSDRFFVHP